MRVCERGFMFRRKVKAKMHDGRTLQLSIFYVGIKQFIQTLKTVQVAQKV